MGSCNLRLHLLEALKHVKHRERQIPQLVAVLLVVRRRLASQEDQQLNWDIQLRRKMLNKVHRRLPPLVFNERKMALAYPYPFRQFLLAESATVPDYSYGLTDIRVRASLSL